MGVYMLTCAWKTGLGSSASYRASTVFFFFFKKNICEIHCLFFFFLLRLFQKRNILEGRKKNWRGQITFLGFMSCTNVLLITE